MNYHHHAILYQSPMSFAADTSGWYIPVPVPPPTFVQPQEPTSPSPEKIDQIKIHDLWQGRLAPFPGFTSRPGLFPVKKHQSVKINSSASTNELSKLQLLPPRSMFNSTNMSPVSTEIKTEENKVSLDLFYHPLL
jgi:hypothetical protein